MRMILVSVMFKLKKLFKALTKDDILQPYISYDSFRSPKIRADDVGYKIYVFDIKHQQKFTASQPNKVEF